MLIAFKGKGYIFRMYKKLCNLKGNCYINYHVGRFQIIQAVIFFKSKHTIRFCGWKIFNGVGHGQKSGKNVSVAINVVRPKSVAFNNFLIKNNWINGKPQMTSL